ncbi:MAG TPA: HAD-IIIA family hydrolase [Candidatus Cloacimonadota bacterium]|nr:HAD-IIIA family hydrolase [Candidatus Cloacimonadota bacterium]HPS39378.1 HAD-IIIA family hydrolase [Candidatus Cloacimonadota bacterium]
MSNITKTYKTPVQWSAIKLLILDCDGVLTDGKIIYAGEDLELKQFDAHDGLGFHIMKHTDMITAVITGRVSAVLARRCADLKIDHLFQGVFNKLRKAEELLRELRLEWKNCVYIGDDWNDIPVMRKVALSCAPADAAEDIRRQADMVCSASGGRGAVREVIDHILHKQGRYDQAVSAYLAEIS